LSTGETYLAQAQSEFDGGKFQEAVSSAKLAQDLLRSEKADAAKIVKAEELVARGYLGAKDVKAAREQYRLLAKEDTTSKEFADQAENLTRQLDGEAKTAQLQAAQAQLTKAEAALAKKNYAEAVDQAKAALQAGGDAALTARAQKVLSQAQPKLGAEREAGSG
jgi:hypothetical protein